MKLRIVGHPRERMSQRGVTEADIEHALENYHSSFVSRASVTYIGPGISGNDLKVWVLPPGIVDDGATIIKSVAWKDEEDLK